DVDAVRRQAHDLAHIVPINTRTLRVVAMSKNRNVNAGGVTRDYFLIRNWSVSAGRLMSADDNRRASQVCVIGQTVAGALFGMQDPLGKEIRVRDVTCRIIGLLETKGTSTFGVDQDD